MMFPFSGFSMVRLVKQFKNCDYREINWVFVRKPIDPVRLNPSSGVVEGREYLNDERCLEIIGIDNRGGVFRTDGGYIVFIPPEEFDNLKFPEISREIDTTSIETWDSFEDIEYIIDNEFKDTRMVVKSESGRYFTWRPTGYLDYLTDEEYSPENGPIHEVSFSEFYNTNGVSLRSRYVTAALTAMGKQSNENGLVKSEYVKLEKEVSVDKKVTHYEVTHDRPASGFAQEALKKGDILKPASPIGSLPQAIYPSGKIYPFNPEHHIPKYDGDIVRQVSVGDLRVGKVRFFILKTKLRPDGFLVYAYPNNKLESGDMEVFSTTHMPYHVKDSDLREITDISEVHHLSEFKQLVENMLSPRLKKLNVVIDRDVV